MEMEVTPAQLADDIVELILKDHLALKNLIEILKDVRLERYEKENQLESFVPLLLRHAKAEQKTLYKKMSEDLNFRMESFQGKTEHEIAEELAQEINRTADDQEWCAKVKVLAESVEKHIREEEQELFPRLRQSMNAQTRVQLGQQYTWWKKELVALLINPYRHEYGHLKGDSL